MANTVLGNGIVIPEKGIKSWYEEIANNYTLIDAHLGDANKHLNQEEKNKIDTLSNVANSGDYNDLINTPTIPSKVSELINDRNFISGVSWEEIEDKPALDIPTKTSDLDNDCDYTTTSYVNSKVANLVNSAPETLDTLNELASALGNDPNFATTIASQIGNKANSSDVYTKQETDTLLSNKASTVDLATVATTGSYNDLLDKPDISSFYTKAQTDELLLSKANSSEVYTKTEVDNEVVHKSGDETIEGSKYFNGNFVDVNGYRLRIKGTNQEAGVIPTDSNKWNGFNFVDKNNVVTFSIANGHLTDGRTFLLFKLLNNNTKTLIDYDEVRFVSNDENAYRYLKSNVYPSTNDKYNLGASSNKWNNVYANAFNGINPGALSLPSNNAIDILSTLQSGGYTAPSNGYVRAIKNVKTDCSSTFGIRNETTGMEDRRITERIFVLGVMVPVQAGEKVIISDDWNSISNATITYSASFYPCKGNV